ncbi:MAG: glycosyl hydrolase [Dactylosporangium sp.]|nr:glycoside hydrolase family 3 C-terminal domain-containing protein [Dactylosporangium sp.]NNJ61261.1 glycosyl hydrolase [Dactylosporangium sp.]
MFEKQLHGLLRRLSLQQKVRLLTGADAWSTHPEPAIGLRRIVVSDGPAGVRGETFDERDPSLSLPSATALGATWDVDLAGRYGAVLADEARRQGVDVVLGPTINLHRSPLGGRHFEAFSEDPLLTAHLAAAYVQGLQERGIGATVKHYVANDAENERLTVDNVVAERPLRELYLAAFEKAIVDSRAWLVMSAYNAVNGPTMTENPLLRTPLSSEWGFDGVVVSDWMAVRSTEASANAAQDLAMPGPDSPWGAALVEAVEAGRVPVAAIDEKVLRLLRLAARIGALDGVPAAVTDPPEPLDGAALAREIAVAGMVLVRNTDAVLPLNATALRGVGVFGHSAEVARFQGGGSATVFPERIVSPLDGLRQALRPAVDVRYVMGAQVSSGILPLPRAAITNPVTGEPGTRVRFLDATGGELSVEDRLAADLLWVFNGIPDGTVTIEVSTVYRPETTGTERLGACGAGPLRLSIDGTERITTVLTDERDPFGGPQSAQPCATIDVAVTAGVAVELVLSVSPPLGGSFLFATITLGTEAVVDEEAELARAADVARDCDVAVVVVGTSASIESEGFDRTTLALPGRQDDLVRAVAAANPRTVVVVNSGSPVLMPWRDEVAAVLLGWFGGQEFGAALAEVLLGTAEPGGRLPTTWPAEEADIPVLNTTPAEDRLVYDEGLHLGYRAWLRAIPRPAYPFGHGLGYTTWQLRRARVPESVDVGQPVPVTVTVANTGTRAGKHVVQVYLAREASAVERPVRWLAGFAPVTVDPGRELETTILVDPRAFAHYQDGWQTEPGAFTVLVGASVDDLPLATTVTLAPAVGSPAA